MVKRSRRRQAIRAWFWAIGFAGLAAVASDTAPAGELRMSLDEIEAMASAWLPEGPTVSVATEHDRLAVQLHAQGVPGLRTALALPGFGALGGRYGVRPETTVDLRLVLVRRPGQIGILAELPAVARLRIVCVGGFCPSDRSLPALVWREGRVEVQLGLRRDRRSGNSPALFMSLGGGLRSICDTAASLVCPVLAALLQPHLDSFAKGPHPIRVDGIAAGPFRIGLQTGAGGADVHFSFCLPADCGERSRDFPVP